MVGLEEEEEEEEEGGSASDNQNLKDKKGQERWLEEKEREEEGREQGVGRGRMGGS